MLHILILSFHCKCVIHRTFSLTQIQHSRQGSGNVALRLIYRIFQRHAFGQIGGDGAGKGASGSVGVRIIDSLSLEPSQSVAGAQQVVGIVQVMAAFQINCTD